MWGIGRVDGQANLPLTRPLYSLCENNIKIGWKLYFRVFKRDNFLLPKSLDLECAICINSKYITR